MWTRLPGLIIIIVIGLIGGLSAKQTDWSAALSTGFEDGQTQVALETEFDDAVWIRNIAINLWAALRYGLLGETARGAVAGNNGWLFSDEEYEAAPGYDDRLNGNIEQIINLHDALSAQGITVVIALIPDKARIMVEHVSRTRPPVLEARYDTILRDLRRADVEVADLRPALIELNMTQSAYLRTDTHWTPAGAQVVASVLVPRIVAATDLRTRFETANANIENHEGDLVSFVNTGAFDVFVGPGEDQLTRFETIAFRETLGLFDEAPNVPGLLVGTSYSANSKWNFLGFLQTESQTDFINLAQVGVGPFPPMRSLLEEGALDQLTPQIVVWEIPERYMTLRDKE